MRRVGHLSQTTIEIIIIAGIVIVLNIIGQYYYSRFDLTKEKQFTLAKSSKEIVSDLPDRVLIKVYVSSDLPPDVQKEEQRLIDILEEYRAAASAHLNIQIVRTDDMDEKELSAIEAKGIQKGQYRASKEEEAILKNFYMGIEISYLDKREVIGFTPEVQNLEYAITSSILKLITTDTPTVGFLTGHGEGSINDQYSEISERLKEICNVQEVDLGTGRKINENIDTLVIIKPTQPITERHRYVIDQFVMRGGKLVYLQVGYKVNQMNGQAEMQIDPLDSLISAYGAKINNDLAVDLNYNLPVPAGSMGGIPIHVPYPLIPIISPPDGFPSDSPATRGLGRLILPWTSSIQLLYDKLPKETQIMELAKTSKESYSHPVPLDLSPQQKFMPPGGKSDLKSQLVAVQLNGEFKSAFEGKPVPALDPDPNAPEGTLPELDTEPIITKSPVTSIVVIANTDFIENQAIKNLPGNDVFFVNLIESLNIGEKLINIRSRTVVNRPLDPDLTIAEKNGLRFWGYMAMPILVTIIGLGRFYLKAQRKRILQATIYSEKSAR